MSTPATKFLTAERILDLHEDISKSRSVRDRGMLESASAAPKWYDMLEEQAAALLRSLTKNHAFVDGNKRTAILATLTFLDINGYMLKEDQKKIFTFVIKVTTTRIPDISWMADWFRERMVEKDGTT